MEPCKLQSVQYLLTSFRKFLCAHNFKRLEIHLLRKNNDIIGKGMATLNCNKY